MAFTWCRWSLKWDSIQGLLRAGQFSAAGNLFQALQASQGKKVSKIIFFKEGGYLQKPYSGAKTNMQS